MVTKKKCGLIRSCQRLRLECSDTCHRLQWLLPVTGLWHLRLNYLQVVMSEFYGVREYANVKINYLDRRNLPRESAPFHHMEELALHSFDARILGILCEDRRQATSKAGKMYRHSYPTLMLDNFTTLLPLLMTSSSPLVLGLNSQKHVAELAEVNRRQLIWRWQIQSSICRLWRFYIILKCSIKHGDLGLLRYSIARSLVMFHGSRSRNYARELIQLYRVIATDAASNDLRRAVLGCSLVNLRGKPDSFFEVDRLVELLKLQLKDLMRTRGNSTLTWIVFSNIPCQPSTIISR